MKNELSRITIDIPASIHKKFKAVAANEGKSMREMVVEWIKKGISAPTPDQCPHTHIPNKKTKKILKNMMEGKEKLLEAKDAKDFYKKLGI